MNIYIYIYNRFHSLHHTKFRTNYSLFMPMYDYIYGTVDESLDETYETCFKRPNDTPNVVHLTHLTTPDSLFHLPNLGIASFSSNPQTQTSKWYLRLLMWPFTSCFTFASHVAFVSERTTFKNLNLQTWVVPRFTRHVSIITYYYHILLSTFHVIVNEVKFFFKKILGKLWLFKSKWNSAKTILRTKMKVWPLLSCTSVASFLIKKMCSHPKTR